MENTTKTKRVNARNMNTKKKENDLLGILYFIYDPILDRVNERTMN